MSTQHGSSSREADLMDDDDGRWLHNLPEQLPDAFDDTDDHQQQANQQRNKSSGLRGPLQPNSDTDAATALSSMDPFLPPANEGTATNSAAGAMSTTAGTTAPHATASSGPVPQPFMFDNQHFAQMYQASAWATATPHPPPPQHQHQHQLVASMQNQSGSNTHQAAPTAQGRSTNAAMFGATALDAAFSGMSLSGPWSNGFSAQSSMQHSHEWPTQPTTLGNNLGANADTAAPPIDKQQHHHQNFLFPGPQNQTYASEKKQKIFVYQGECKKTDVPSTAGYFPAYVGTSVFYPVPCR